MSDTRNHRWILESRPKPGPLSQSDFRLVEEKISPIKDGEFLVRNLLLSFDPTQRFWMERDTYLPKIELGAVIRGFAVALVIESKSRAFAVGSRVAGLFGWQQFAVCSAGESQTIMHIPDEISDEAALSVLGMTGLTGYFGMKEIGKPLAGETVLVSGAAGATGSVAAQVANNLGAKVIGIAGGAEKCKWLIEKAKLYAAIDYKSQNIETALRDYAPKGINVFFDNVGGKTLDVALLNLAMHARVVLCGSISGYDGTANASISNYMNLVLRRGTMSGFLIFDYAHRFREGCSALASMINEGNLAYEVDIQHGLENAPQTLQRLFDGKNLGKQLLRL